MVEIDSVAQSANAVIAEVEKAIVGKTDVVRLAVLTILCNGHLLIEDIPGVGKTTLAKALAKAIGGEFRRVQFTPDLLPADITGSSIYNQAAAKFEFVPGPVFGNIVLVDEINRATPKTQSSLLEAMEERQVTTDGVTRELPKPFFVIATQNNIEMTGTYALPEAQLDRFLVRLSIGYPDRGSEVDMLELQQYSASIDQVQRVMHLEELLECQRAVREVSVDPKIRDYVVEIVRQTRDDARFVAGASPRGSIFLMRAAQTHAAMAGRRYVEPEDVKSVAPSVLAHRIMAKADLRTKTDVEGVIRDILRSIPIPTFAATIA